MAEEYKHPSDLTLRSLIRARLKKSGQGHFLMALAHACIINLFWWWSKNLIYTNRSHFLFFIIVFIRISIKNLIGFVNPDEPFFYTNQLIF